MVSMLEGVVLRGTGRKIKSLEMPLAGKTGTTNESKDAWFVGFSPNLVVGVYAGFDEPQTLGKYETMITYNGKWLDYQERCDTLQQAKIQHQEALLWVMLK